MFQGIRALELLGFICFHDLETFQALRAVNFERMIHECNGVTDEGEKCAKVPILETAHSKAGAFLAACFVSAGSQSCQSLDAARNMHWCDPCLTV